MYTLHPLQNIQLKNTIMLSIFTSIYPVLGAAAAEVEAAVVVVQIAQVAVALARLLEVEEVAA